MTLTREHQKYFKPYTHPHFFLKTFLQHHSLLSQMHIHGTPTLPPTRQLQQPNHPRTSPLPMALPTIAASFHASGPGFAWVGSAYLLGQTASVLFREENIRHFRPQPLIVGCECGVFAGSVVLDLSGGVDCGARRGLFLLRITC